MRDEMSPVLEATLEAARSTARAGLQRSLDDAVASTSDAWRRELDRVSEAWASERRELEARCASLAERADELEAHNATLAQQLRAAEAAGAMAAAETRKTRAELDEARDDVDARRDKMRAELEVWRESSVKYRKRMEHAERALARVKARANAAGFVEATQLTPDHAPTRRRPSRDPPPTSPPRATKTTPGDRAGSPAAPSPAPGPALAPVATAAAKKRTRPPHPAPGVENMAAIASGARMDPPNRADAETARLGIRGPAAAGPSSKWRRTGGGGALRDEPSLRANGVGADVAHLWGDGSPRVGAARGGGGGFAPRRAGDAFADEDREIFKIAPRRDAEGLDGGGEAPPARNGDERNPTTRGTGTGIGTGPVGARRETKRVEVIRDKATRAALPAFTCEECDKFYAAAERSGVERPRGACTHRPGPGMHNSWSRHRARWAPPPAPEGFWNLGMTQTQKTTTDAGGDDERRRAAEPIFRRDAIEDASPRTM